MTLLAVVLIVACGGTEPVSPSPVPPLPSRAGVEVDSDPTGVRSDTLAVAAPPSAARPVPSSTAAAAPSPAVQITVPPIVPAAPAEYDSDHALDDIFPAFSIVGPELEETLEQVVAEDDQSLVPFLVEILRFMPSRNSQDLVGQALRDLTGERFESTDWDLWMEWLGHNADRFDPPSAYVSWKARTYAAIHPRFAQFIRPAAEFSRIDLTEVVWGGVIPDGIPDLRNPHSFTPDEVDYLLPDDRVFGVHINGESKAYPLRVVNAHEMVNDQVGGEPISLMW